MLDHGGDIQGFVDEFGYAPLDYSANVSPLGLPDEVVKAIEGCIADLAAYPDPLCRKLTTALAAHHGIDRAHILCGNGCSDLIYRIARVLAPKLSAEGYERSVVFYSLTIPNIGYAGYALAEGIYGERMLLNALIFGLPMSFWIYSEGYRMLMNSGRVSLRRFFNPCIIGMLIGCIFGLTNLRVPTLVQSVASQASGCMAPVSMLLLGITIADYDLSEILRNKRAYVISALRLLVIPLVLCVVLSRFLPEQIVLVAVLLYCMPCGLNTVVFPKLIGEDCRLGASLSLISSLFAILTIPFCLQAVAWMY